MTLSSPTLFFTTSRTVEEFLIEQSGTSPGYLSHAPNWVAYDELASQISFGLIVVEYSVLVDEGGNFDKKKVSRLIDEALEGNPQARIIVYDVPDEETLSLLIDAGSHDVVRAPLSVQELVLRIERAAETYTWLSQKNYFIGQSGHIFRLDDIIGESEPMHTVFEQVSRVASSRSPVLITGETGSGKELIAAAIHYNSTRKDQAFIKVNCAALQDTLLESELFGHEKGSFTGAVRQRIGRFEQAHRGTLFLDEVGDMSPATQAKVLRVLQSQEFERLGGTRLIRVDVRIIAATNQLLEQAIAESRFREDLFYRLNVITIHLPALRERTADIPLLAQFFLKKALFEERKQVSDFTPEAMEFLLTYPWPGNVRELENTVYRAVLLADGNLIKLEDLSILQQPGIQEPVAMQRALHPKETAAAMRTPTAGANRSLEEIERAAIVDALETTAYVQSRAARLLGISRRSLNYKIGKYGITHPSWRVNTPDETT